MSTSTPTSTPIFSTITAATLASIPTNAVGNYGHNSLISGINPNIGNYYNPNYYVPNYNSQNTWTTYPHPYNNGFVGSGIFKAFNRPYPKNVDDGSNEIKKMFRVPILFETEVAQKHLSIWRTCNEPWNDDEYLIKNIDTYNDLVGYLNFFDQGHANEFMAWWNHYIEMFGDTDYKTNNYPVMKKGKIDGYFVETLTGEYVAKAGEGSGNLMQDQWVWIVKNTKNGATQVNNGWIFKSEADASLFILLNRS